MKVVDDLIPLEEFFDSRLEHFLIVKVLFDGVRLEIRPQ